jgi:pimeloyl-ACP methyl ester carboxylesterase
MSNEQGGKFSHAFESVYAELEKSADFMDVGSALGEAYGNMFLGVGPVGHMYVYFPGRADGGPRPVLVFLHGWLGNLKGYTWAWREFAEENGFVIIAPSFGNGLWSGQRADKMLKWIDQFIRKDARLDQSRVIVVGLSNGGTGVTRWAKVLPDSYRGLVYVSPVMAGTSDSPDFLSSVGSRPILVVNGSADSRISPSYVEQHFTALRRGGANIQRQSYRGEDHVLILSSRKRLQTDLRRWMVKYGLLEEFKQQE